ncbi:MAG TPA: mechanosensitive ion channel domain-containing protein [Rhizomicrobium sp.]|nr:mechanosensitive ion channel domain-containing protein [Rhizomicrobium sp.]
MAADFTLPTLFAAASAAGGKAALPALTVMVVNAALDFLAASLILIAGWTLSRWFGRWVNDILGRASHIDATLKPLLASFARYAILTITTVAVLGQFGVQTTSLIALLGAAGLALGLALQGTLSNVASGVMLLALRPFRVADKIVLSGITGTVREIGLFRSALVTDDGVYVSIPNTTIFSGIILNVSREPARRAEFTVDIDQAADIHRARETILAALASDSRVMKSPAPDVTVDSLSGSQVLLTVRAWLTNQNFGGAQSDLRIAVRETLTMGKFSPPIPIPAPAVAPWTPPAENAGQPGPPQPKAN